MKRALVAPGRKNQELGLCRDWGSQKTVEIEVFKCKD